ncbi:PQQ-binding-like beta-propeller repeat protein, partial [Escherichia coli]|nr:PQQ-binding-like beta-propeller repeat protein [Escherichia coli]
GSVTDNFSTRETSGVIRGFDVNTGELLWAFDPGAKDPNAIPSDEHTFTFNSPNSWAPAAYDAKLDLVYLPMGVTTPDIWGGNRTPEVAIANPMALPFVSKLIPRGPGNPMEQPKDAKGTGTESGIQPQYGVPYGVTLNPFLSPFGLPCKQPAWGYISALDLKTNEVVWKKRIGTPQDSMPFPMPVPVPFNMGMPMLGGPISTAGNVLFIAATADNYLRAYNMSNGEKLWQGRLPAGGQATPMTYEVNG